MADLHDSGKAFTIFSAPVHSSVSMLLFEFLSIAVKVGTGSIFSFDQPASHSVRLIVPLPSVSSVLKFSVQVQATAAVPESSRTETKATHFFLAIATSP